MISFSGLKGEIKKMVIDYYLDSIYRDIIRLIETYDGNVREIFLSKAELLKRFPLLLDKEITEGLAWSEEIAIKQDISFYDTCPLTMTTREKLQQLRKMQSELFG
jgi:hypothetical protein